MTIVATIAVTGDIIAFASLLVAALVAVFTFGPMRARLSACEHDRRELRLNLQLVVGAMLGLIPEPDRLQLLKRIGENVPPYGGLADDV